MKIRLLLLVILCAFCIVNASFAEVLPIQIKVVKARQDSSFAVKITRASTNDCYFSKYEVDLNGNVLKIFVTYRESYAAITKLVSDSFQLGSLTPNRYTLILILSSFYDPPHGRGIRVDTSSHDFIIDKQYQVTNLAYQLSVKKVYNDSLCYIKYENLPSITNNTYLYVRGSGGVVKHKEQITCLSGEVIVNTGQWKDDMYRVKIQHERFYSLFNANNTIFYVYHPNKKDRKRR